jgi:hypothetical protein
MFKGFGAYVAAAALAASVSLVISAQQGPRFAAPIRLKAATFTPASGEQPEVPPGLMIAGYAAGQRGYFIVQFAGPVMDAWKAQAAAAGAELLDYLPEFAFKARMTPEAAARVAALDAVAWVGVFHPAYKLDPALRRAGAATRVYRVRIERGSDIDAAVDAIAGAGPQIVGRDGNFVEVTAAPGQLNAVAHVLDVAEIDAFVLRNKNNEFGDASISALVDGAASLTTGGIATYTYAVASPGSPFKVRLAWRDPGSSASAAKNLANDLNLVVTAPDGTQYLGNVFTGAWSHTGGAADHVNSLENVRVASAIAGTWTVVVHGYNIPSGPQPFALIVDGVFAPAVQGSIPTAPLSRS